jgi:hypothetical protein
MTELRQKQQCFYPAGVMRRMAMASLACCLAFAAAQAQQQREFQGGGGSPQVEPQPAPGTAPPAGVVPPAGVAPPGEQAPSSYRPGFIDALGRWFGDSKAAIDSQLKSTQETIGSIGRDARDAAGSVVAVPGTRVVTGRQLCPVAPNGAPDCQQGVDTLCRAKGFQSGRSLDVQSGNRCSVKSLVSGRATREAPCPVETYVTRAVCQ